MTNIGWIRLHRKLKNSSYYKKSQYVHLWIHLLLSANHQENKFMWNKDIIIIKEGQFLTGRKELSEATGIPETTIERALEFFEKNGHQIEQQKTTKFRIITIVNWKEYQGDNNKKDRKTDNRRTTDGQQTDTNNNDNNDNNDNKSVPASAVTTPAETSKLFFNSEENQEKVITYLIEKGVADILARQELSKFISYWTELNKSGSKQRWEMEKTFEVQRRLNTWFANMNKFNNKSKKSIQSL